MALPKLAWIGSSQHLSSWLLTAISRVATFEAVCCEDGSERSFATCGARWSFSDPLALLKEAEPDGVVLASPMGERPRLIRQCLSAGASVLVPGMPAPAKACARLHAFSKLSGRSLVAGSASRYSPSVLMARRLIEAGKVGRPISMALQITQRGAIREGKEDDGAAPFDLVFEAVELVQFLVGPIHRVSSIASGEGALVSVASAGENVAVSIVLHVSGSPETVGTQLEIRGADATRLTIDADARLICGQGSRVDGARRPSLSSIDPVMELGFEGLLGEFRRSLSATSSGAGVSALRTACAATEAILESAARSRPVVLTKQFSKEREAKAEAGVAGRD